MDTFVSRQQAAEALSVDPQTVDRLRKQGLLRSVKVGRRVAISAESLSQYIARITNKQEEKR